MSYDGKTYSYLDNSKTLVFFGTKGLKKILERLPSRTLRKFLAMNTAFGSDQLNTLLSWGKVKILSLANTLVADNSEAYLQADTLERLDVRSTSVGDPFFQNFRRFTKLISVHASQTCIGKYGLRRLPISIEELSLGETEIDERCISYLPRFSSLDGLNLDNSTVVHERSVPQIAKITNLKHLSINNTKVGSLDKRGVQVNTSCLEFLLNIPHLSRLSVINCNLGDQDLQHLSNLELLSSLDLSRNIWISSALEDLFSSNSLEEVDLTKCGLRPSCFKGVKASPRLFRLRLAHNVRLNLESYQDLVALSSIRELDLKGNFISNKALKLLTENLKLRKLHLNSCYLPFNLFDNVDLSYLECLDLSVTNVNARHLTEVLRFEKLKHLMLRETKIAEDHDAIEELKWRMPNCKITL